MTRVICGPMYASKTSKLLREVDRAKYEKKKVLVFKPVIDNRYSQDHVVSHNGIRHEAILLSDVYDLLVYAINEKPDMIAIDEAQFFTSDLDQVLTKVTKLGIEVTVSGLTTDFRGQPFPTMIPLIFNARELVKLTAVCICGSEATMNQRVIDGIPITDGDVVQVGGQESYEARCRHCFIYSETKANKEYWFNP